MLLPGRKSDASKYRFGFNGKENDNEVKGTGNEQDYGMRIHDTRLVRFLSVDPLARKYPELTPYQFASNHPISSVDVDGLEADVKFDGIERQDRIAAERKYPNDPRAQESFIRERQNVRGMAVAPVFVLVNAAAVPELATAAYCWVFCNAVTACDAAITITCAATGYDGPGPVGYTNVDFSELGKTTYQGWTKKGVTNKEELAGLARNAYNKIVGTIDEEIKGLPSLKEKAMKAFDIRNKAKDFAREASGLENKAAAEAMSMDKHGSVEGPSFDGLYKKYKEQNMSDDKIYQEIIDASKRTNPVVNKRYGSQ